MNEFYDIVVSTPPADLPHDTAVAEIERLVEYLRVMKTSPDGTARVVMDPAELADNTDKIQIVTDELNNITAIKSFVSGEWKTWLLDTGNLDPEALDTMLSIVDEKLKVNLDEDTLPLTEAVDGKQTVYAHPRVDGTTILYETVAEKEQLTAKQPLAYFQGKWIYEDFTLTAPASWVNAGYRTIAKDFGSMEVTDDGYWIEVTEPGYYMTSLSFFVANFEPNTELVATVMYKLGSGGTERFTSCQARYSNYFGGGETKTTECDNFESHFQHITQAGAPVVLDLTAITDTTPAYVRVKLVGNSTRGRLPSTGGEVIYHAYGEGLVYPFIGEATIIALYKIGDTLA